MPHSDADLQPVQEVPLHPQFVEEGDDGSDTQKQPEQLEAHHPMIYHKQAVHQLHGSLDHWLGGKWEGHQHETEDLPLQQRVL